MYVTIETVITAGAVLSAISAFVALVWKMFKWINHQKEQDVELEQIHKEITVVREMHLADQEAIQTEQTVMVYGLLACLKGLAEKGCNGPVSEAIVTLEKHINQKAHRQI